MSGVRISVKSDVNAVIVSLEGYRKELIDGAVVRALDRTAITVRAEAAREIHGEYPGLKIGAVKDRIRIERASKITLRTIISVSGRPIPVIEFSPTPNARGLMVKIKSQRKLIRHAFITKVLAGTKGAFHIGAFVRTGEFRIAGKGTYVGTRREVIKQLFSISLPTAFSNKKVMDAVVRAAKERFPGALAQEANWLKFKKAA